MKALLLAVFGVSVLSCGLWAQDGAPGNDFFSVAYNRKSVRNFTGDPVKRSDLEKAVRAGMAAPTAVNKQPWAFVIVTERNLLDDLVVGLPYARMLDKAAAAIVVCVVPDQAYQQDEKLAVMDGSCASENILLAIEAMGLGGVWTAVYPDSARVDHVRNVLDIPANVIPLNVITVGVPTGEDKPKDKFKTKTMLLNLY